MLLRHTFLLSIVSLWFLCEPICAQEIQNEKSGVVRIYNFTRKVQGTGFIIRVERDNVYIVTASHIVGGAEYHNIYYLNDPNTPIKGRVVDREAGDKGLALLLVSGNDAMASSVKTLTLGQTSASMEGRSVQIIGFPEGTTRWTITSGTIARVDGRELIIEASIKSGNSGGPVLMNGKVIGMVTDIDSFGHAAQVESILQYLRGNDIDIETSTARKVSIRITNIPPYDPKGGAQKFVVIAGEVIGGDLHKFRVLLFSFTNKWYVQPEEGDPLTFIGSDGKWKARIHPGSKYAALLVKSVFKFEAIKPRATLPVVGGDVIDVVEIEGIKQ